MKLLRRRQPEPEPVDRTADWEELLNSYRTWAPLSVVRARYHAEARRLGPAAPRPLELTKWHDLIFHVVFRAHSNGVLQVWHRLEGGSWELLYSDVPGDGAVVQRAPHPTMQWNLQYDAAGNPKSLNEPASIFMQMYRGKPHATEHIYNAGIVRRQSEAAVRAVFP